MVNETIYVIKNQSCCLLSRSACRDLGLIVRVDEVDSISTPPNFRSEFPSLFNGLGKFNTEYHITLGPDPTPVCLYAPRKVPLPLLPKVKQEIEKMEQLGVISPITGPTDWCSGIVVVPKANVTVRLCVDLTALNRSVKR